MKIKIPPLTDVRYIALAFQTTLLVTAIFTDYVPHPWMTVFACMALAIGMDFLLIRWKWGHWEMPLGSISAAYGCLFFIRSYQLEMLLLTVAISVLSKYVIRFNGRHIFNPSNFGIVFMLVVFAADIASHGSRWGTTLIFPAITIFFGIPVLWRAKKLVLTGSLFLLFPLLAVSRALIFGGSPVLFAGITISTAFVISFFFMVTDPVTSPRTNWGQFLFALAIAFTDQALRHFQYPDATQYAIFIAASLNPVSQLIYAKWTGREVALYKHWSIEKSSGKPAAA